MDPRRRDDREAVGVVVEAANADLNRPGGIDDPLSGGPQEHRSVVEPRTVVIPGVAVGIELQQRQWAMHLGVGPQQRIAHEVVAAQGDHRGIGGEDGVGMSLDDLSRIVRIAEVELAVAVVDHFQMVERVETPGEGVEFGHHGRGGPNGPRTHAGARAIAGGRIEGDPRYRHVDAVEVPAVPAPQERQSPSMDQLDPLGLARPPPEGKVSFRGSRIGPAIRSRS